MVLWEVEQLTLEDRAIGIRAFRFICEVAHRGMGYCLVDLEPLIYRNRAIGQ